MSIKFDLVDTLLNIDYSESNNPIYCDTDSIFLSLPVVIEENKKKSDEYINNLQDIINEEKIDHFLKLHNIKIREKEAEPLLKCVFKNEYMIKSMILYSKKRYISIFINYDKEGKRYYDIDLKGVEGKRATNKFVKILVDDLIEYLKSVSNIKNIYTRNELLEYILERYHKEINAYKNKSIYENIEYFSMPVNVNKYIKDLKTVSGYYKGTLVFDIVGEKLWDFSRGKGRWLKVILKDESYIPKIMSDFKKFEQIKIENKKPLDLITDITIPDELLVKETPVIDQIFKVFDIDYESYYEQLLKKIALLYMPFDILFCKDLHKRMRKDVPTNFLIFGEKSTFSNCKELAIKQVVEKSL